MRRTSEIHGHFRPWRWGVLLLALTMAGPAWAEEHPPAKKPAADSKSKPPAKAPAKPAAKSPAPAPKPVAAGAATAPAAKPAEANAPAGLSISSDTLEMDDQQHTATFTGNVVAVDGELNLAAQRMTVHYQPSSGASSAEGGQKVEMVVADGNVVIRQKESEARGSQAKYWTQKNVMEITNNQGLASIQQGNEHLRGHRIRIQLGADRRIAKVEALGGGKDAKGGRVTARINPGGSLLKQ